MRRRHAVERRGAFAGMVVSRRSRISSSKGIAALGEWWLYAVGIMVALLIGVESSHLYAVVIGLVTLAPLVSHARHVGWRHVLSEPSAATIIVGFYLAIFPLRALVIAASGYGDVYLAHGAVSPGDLVSVLLLASLATTALVESYYLALGQRTPQPEPNQRPSQHGAVALATVLTSVALLALVGVLAQYGGIKGAQAAFLAHNVVAALQGKTSIAESAWGVFAVPAVWAASYVAINRGAARWVRVLFGVAGAIIVLAALVVYGSRLSALLAAMGVWVVLYYSGRRIPARLILIMLPLAVLLSQPILSHRASSLSHVSTIERLSRTAGYEALDVALAIYREPQQVRAQLDQPRRWLDLPAYYVPSFIWHGRPNLASRRYGLYVAQDLGTVNDQATGFPSTYITETWLMGGWPVTLLVSVLFGALLGWTRRHLVPSPLPSAAAVLTYCFIVTLGWTYYKDGDIVSTIVGQGRNAAYLGLLMFVTGVVGSRVRSTHRSSTTARRSRTTPPPTSAPSAQ